MSGTDHHKPGEKSGKRKQKRARKTEQHKVAPERVAAKHEPIEAMTAPQAPEATIESAAVAVEAAPAERVERVASFRERMASVMPPANPAPGTPSTLANVARTVPSPTAAPAAGIEALANAYRDYTRKSLAEAQSFAEKLSAARSFDKAVEAQTEFAKKACETFAADSRKIRELHRELFWQTFRLPNWPLGRSR